MRIDIISALPSLLESPFSDSILKRAINNALVSLVIHDLREYGVGKHRQIDDYQFGGSAGMVMTVEPLYNAINKLKKEREYDEIIYMTPDGGRFDQPMANELSLKKNLKYYLKKKIKQNMIACCLNMIDHLTPKNF